MRPDEHLGGLFSAVYDRELGNEETMEFHAHLASCPKCTSEFAHFRASIDAVRALPAAPMPAGVRLPAGSPEAEPDGQPARLLRPVSRLPVSRGWAAGLAGVAAAAAIIGVAAVRLGGGTSTTSPQLAAAPPAAPESRAGTGSVRAGCGQLGAAAGYAAVTSEVSPAALRDALVRYPNRASFSAPERPGQTLTIAVPARQVAAGARLPVLATLTSDRPAKAGAEVVAPCVTLVGPVAATGAPATGASGPAAAAAPLGLAPRAALGGTPLAIAAISGSAPGGVPVQEIVIPANLAPGTVLQLTAVAHPAGVAPLTAQLSITVG